MNPTTRIAVLTIAIAITSAAADGPPRQWIDPDTGHRIVRLSQDPGTASLYFNQNAYTADGERIIVTTPDGGIATINMKTGAIVPVVAGRVSVIVAGRKTGQVYYMKDGAIFAANVTTKAAKQIAKLEVRGSVA